MLSKNIFLMKFLIYISLIAASVMFLGSKSYWSYIVGFCVLGILNAHGIQLLHQASHWQGSKNKNLNECMGIFLGLIAFIPFNKYRSIHLEHHKNLGTKEDIEFFGYQSTENLSRKSLIISKIFSLERFVNVLGVNGSSKMIRSEIILSIFVLFVLTACLLSSNVQIVFGWVASYILITEPIHFLIEIPEHYGCDKLSSDKNRNTRTILYAPKLIGWFTNWNNFHSEHHRYPNIVPEQLFVLAKSKKPDGLYCQMTYAEFFKFYFRSVLKGKQ